MNYIVYKIFTLLTAIATGAVVVIDMIMGAFDSETLIYLCVCVGLSVNVFNEYLDKVLGIKK
jgi:hypothetical protein